MRRAARLLALLLAGGAGCQTGIAVWRADRLDSADPFPAVELLGRTVTVERFHGVFDGSASPRAEAILGVPAAGRSVECEIRWRWLDSGGAPLSDDAAAWETLTLGPGESRILTALGPAGARRVQLDARSRVGR